ncbi:unnamed protein product [Rhizopus stolonifer]
MERAHMTNAEMEDEFRERNTNLKNDVSNFVNNATSKTHDMLGKAQQNATSMGTGSIDNSTQSTGSTMNNTKDASMEMGHDANQSLMNNIRGDIQDMHSTDPHKFGHIANKTDETFGDKAL